MDTTTARPPVCTRVAAHELGIEPWRLRLLARQGCVTPDLVTVGGHYRWQVEQVRTELEQISGS